MTIDEMIATCEEGSKATWNGRLTQGALERRQLAEWLKELKSHREAWGKVKRTVKAYLMLEGFGSACQYDIEKLIEECRPKEGENE